MVHYTVSLKIDETRAAHLNANGSKLCVAKVVKDATGKEHCNVLAMTRDKISTNMDISWEDEYQILGSNTAFQEGVRIAGFPDGLPIEFGQTYKIDERERSSVFTDPSVDNNSFGFQQEVACSPMLLMKVEGRFVPVYISPAQRGPGNTVITPVAKVQIWFQDFAVASTMSVTYKSMSHPVDLVPNGRAWVEYNREGRFVPYNPPA